MTTRLYIGKIGNLNKKDLQKLCAQYGSIKDFMMRDTYAFVEYSSEHETQSAQLELDGRSINGQRILVEPAKPKVEDIAYFMDHPRLYVGKLPAQISKNDLVNLFSPFGEVTDILLKEDFAFVEFDGYKSAQNALKELNGYCIGGSRILVEEARPKEDEIEMANLLIYPRLYVGKLSENVRRQDLTDAFSAYGDIQDILMKDDFAFIEFSNVQAATKALLDMNGAKLCGTKIIVEEAKPREGDAFPKRGGMSKSGFRDRWRVNDQVLAAMKRRAASKKRRSPYRSLSRSRSKSEEKESGKVSKVGF